MTQVQSVERGCLISPSLIYSPILSDSGVNLRTQPHWAYQERLVASGIPPDEIAEIMKKRGESGFFRDAMLSDFSNQRLVALEAGIRDAHKELQSVPIGNIDQNRKSEWTRKTILRLFPALNIFASQPSLEKNVFGGLTIETFIDRVALPNAFGFYNWSIDPLPPISKYRQNLQLVNEVDSARSFFDLVRILPDNQQSQSDEKGKYNTEINHQVLRILELIYIATIAEVTRNPEEEMIMAEFEQEVSGAFSHIEENILAVKLSPAGICQSINLAKASHADTLGFWDDKLKQWIQGYNIFQQYKMRRFGTQTDEAAVFDPRIKELYPRMLKLIRERRYPLTDTIGGRFTLINNDHLPFFLGELESRLENNWHLQREPIPTKSPESDWQEGEKYAINHKAYPHIPIEIQIQWLREHNKPGMRAQNIFGFKENFHRYRLTQLRKYLYNYLFPFWISGVNWNFEATINELNKYAFEKTKKEALATNYFPD